LSWNEGQTWEVFGDCPVRFTLDGVTFDYLTDQTNGLATHDPGIATQNNWFAEMREFDFRAVDPLTMEDEDNPSEIPPTRVFHTFYVVPD